MRVVICALEGVSRYSQSKRFNIEKGRDETHEDFEKAHWRERCHYDGDREVFIPPMQFKTAIANAARYKSEPIKGKGKATYTKHFKSGILCVKPVMLGIKVDDIQGEWLSLKPPTQSGAVLKCMPYVDSWTGDVEFMILDECITKDVFSRTLADAGAYIGIGRFRPQCGGYYGRFSVQGIRW